MHYWVRPGAGKLTVFLLHGAGVDHEMFNSNLGAVPAEVGMIAWDARGHGRSVLPPRVRFRYSAMVADFWAVCAAEGVEQLIPVGQSLGGNLAQTVTRQRPRAVRRLVLIDCTDNAQQLSRLERIELAVAGPILAAYPTRMLLRQSAATAAVTPAARSYLREALTRTGKRRFVDIMRFAPDALIAEPGHRFGCPTLLVLGAKDRTGNIAKAMRRRAAADPLCRLEVIPGAGHLANLDRPDLVNPLLTRFLQSD